VTPIVPYARERYFENHKMMSAVDKLHKLHASTVPPVVWARSPGVEVLNEIDTLKAGIISAAGGDLAPVLSQAPHGKWPPVEALVSGTQVIGTGLKSVTGGILQQLARVASVHGKDRGE
jgi:ubiquinone biosynthesis monooxygenase Coq6